MDLADRESRRVELLRRIDAGGQRVLVGRAQDGHGPRRVARQRTGGGDHRARRGGGVQRDRGGPHLGRQLCDLAVPLVEGARQAPLSSGQRFVGARAVDGRVWQPASCQLDHGAGLVGDGAAGHDGHHGGPKRRTDGGHQQGSSQSNAREPVTGHAGQAGESDERRESRDQQDGE